MHAEYTCKFFFRHRGMRWERHVFNCSGFASFALFFCTLTQCHGLWLTEWLRFRCSGGREGSVIKALRAFKRELGRQQAHTLLRWVRRFQEQGTVSGVQPGRGRPHVPDEMIRRVQQAMRRNPRLSIRRLSARTGIPRATVHRAVRQVLRLPPYKLQLVQSLHRGDKRRRVEFSQWLLQKWSSASFR